MERIKSLKLDRDDQELLEDVFFGIFGRSYENPTEAEYIFLIIGLFRHLERGTKIRGKPGRPKKKSNTQKIELYLAMRREIREVKGGSDLASQSLYRKNSFGRSNWKALKVAYFSYRKDLIDEFLGGLDGWQSTGFGEDIFLQMILSPNRLEKPK